MTTPPTGGDTTPPPSTTPPASHPHGTPPAGASSYLDGTGIHLYRVSGSYYTAQGTGTVHGFVGPRVTLHNSANHSQTGTLRKIITGGHAGLYAHASEGTYSAI